MLLKIANLVRSLDNFGHSIKVNYRGEESFNSFFGGVMTIMVYSLTLVMVIRAVNEIHLMEDPILSEYSRPINIYHKRGIVPLLQSDYNFVLGFSTKIFGMWDKDPEKSVAE